MAFGDDDMAADEARREQAAKPAQPCSRWVLAGGCGKPACAFGCVEETSPAPSKVPSWAPALPESLRHGAQTLRQHVPGVWSAAMAAQLEEHAAQLETPPAPPVDELADTRQALQVLRDTARRYLLTQRHIPTAHASLAQLRDELATLVELDPAGRAAEQVDPTTSCNRCGRSPGCDCPPERDQ